MTFALFLWVKNISFRRRPGEQLFEYWQTGKPGFRLELVLPPPESFPQCGMAQPKLTKAAYSRMLEDTLVTTVTFFESDDYSYRPDWLLGREAPPLLSHIRRALQIVIAFMPADEADADFYQFITDLAMRRPKAA